MHVNLFSVTWVLHKYFQDILEGGPILINKHITTIMFDEKILNTYGSGYILATRL